MNQSSIYKNFKMLAIAAGMLIVPQLAAAQCVPEAAVGAPGSCQALGYPLCYVCDTNAPEPGCVPSTTFCDDGNECTNDVCTADFVPAEPLPNHVPYTVGCVSTSIALDGDEANPLDTACYLSESDENGICEPSLGENCSNTPDCKDKSGFPCPPTNPPYIDGIPPLSFCNTTTDPDEPPFETLACADGDVCTTDICTPLVLVPQIKFQQVGTCSNEPKDCSPEADGCCPTGCTPPAFGETCFGAGPIAGCDPDCFPAPVCGDGFVGGSETCDQTVPGDQAGLKPDGSVVTDAECRAPGAAGECGYCGDGVVQAGAEQCDGSNDNACGGLGCDSNCQCNPAARCLTGSGEIINGELKNDCATCSLNPEAMANGFSAYSLAALLGLSLVAGIALRRKAQ